MPGMRPGPGGGRRRRGRVLPRCDAPTRRVSSVGADSRADGVVEGILRQSDERWGNYLDPLDPTNAGPSLADEPDPFDESEIEQDDPPALECRRPCSVS